MSFAEKIFVLFVWSIFSIDGQAALWSSTVSSEKSKIAELCQGEEKCRISVDDFSKAIIFKSENQIVTLCVSEELKLNYATSTYLLKYNLPQNHIVLCEGGMMSHGLEYDISKGEGLRFQIFWPAEKSVRRKVQELKFECIGACALNSKCVVERLTTDLSPSKLFEVIESKLKTKNTRKNFVMSPKKKDTLLLDQLYIEALTGSSKAKELIDGLGTGGDAAWSELIGTYQWLLKDSKAKKCKWQETQVN